MIARYGWIVCVEIRINLLFSFSMQPFHNDFGLTLWHPAQLIFLQKFLTLGDAARYRQSNFLRCHFDCKDSDKY